MSDPDDPEYQARKRGEEQDGKLRKVAANVLKKAASKIMGEKKNRRTEGTEPQEIDPKDERDNNWPQTSDALVSQPR